jgi:hypothetical protein
MKNSLPQMQKLRGPVSLLSKVVFSPSCKGIQPDHIWHSSRILATTPSRAALSWKQESNLARLTSRARTQMWKPSLLIVSVPEKQPRKYLEKHGYVTSARWYELPASPRSEPRRSKASVLSTDI